jgi:hypothetical protein
MYPNLVKDDLANREDSEVKKQKLPADWARSFE